MGPGFGGVAVQAGRHFSFFAKDWLVFHVCVGFFLLFPPLGSLQLITQMSYTTLSQKWTPNDYTTEAVRLLNL